MVRTSRFFFLALIYLQIVTYPPLRVKTIYFGHNELSEARYMRRNQTLQLSNRGSQHKP